MRGWGPGEGRCGGEMRVCWKQLSSSASACHTNMPGGWWGQALVMTGSSRVKEGTEVVHGLPLKLSRLEERHFSNCCGKISQKVRTKGEEFFFSLCPFVALLLPMTYLFLDTVNQCPVVEGWETLSHRSFLSQPRSQPKFLLISVISAPHSSHLSCS